MESNLNVTATQVNQNVRFKLLSVDQFKKRPAIRWVVKNLLPTQGLAIMYGQSGTGKTFLLLDLLLAIACCDEWFGHLINNTSVCYVCLEGASGIQQRIAAWEKATGRLAPSNFRIITNSFSLIDKKDVNDLAAAIIEGGSNGGVIAIDTLNAATPRMDENSSKEMGDAINNLRHLQRLTGGLIMTSHHTGKDERQGMRGHSSLHGAIDVQIYLKGTKSNRSWNLQKIRDYENGETHNFKLAIHELGLDEDGEVTTSCTIESDTPKATGRRVPVGQNQRLVFTKICNTIEEECKKAGHPVAIAHESIIENAALALAKIDKHKRNSEAKKIVRNLINKNYFETRIESGNEFIALL